MATPMDGFLVDRQVNKVFNILKDQSLACVWIIGYELLNHT
jgi:hypothetical protein